MCQEGSWLLLLHKLTAPDVLHLSNVKAKAQWSTKVRQGTTRPGRHRDEHGRTQKV